MTCTRAPVPPLALTAADVAAWREDWAAYHALYAPRFPAREPREPARFSLAGRLSDEHRQSVARRVLPRRGAARNAGRTAPMCVGQGRWSEEALLAPHGRPVALTLGHPWGVIIVEGRDWPKQGPESVGVARPYGGARGQKAHGPAGVFRG